MDSWQQAKQSRLWFEAEGIGVDTQHIQMPSDAAERLSSQLTAALEWMSALEAGAPANVTEKRSVGHYWLRAPELSSTAEIQREIRETLQKIHYFVEKIHSGAISSPAGKFTDVLCIGIGGSVLGTQFVADALKSANDKMRLHFLDNTDPDGFVRLWETLGDALNRTLVIVISKSGSTPEPRNAMRATANYFQSRKLNFPAQAVAITCEESPLDDLAREQHWLARFPMWKWVGGRTSVTSAVGLLPLALQGIDGDAFLAGAARMDELTRQRENNPALQLALAWQFATDGQGRKNMVILPYRDALGKLANYLQQLIMESLGKAQDLAGNSVQQGITVYGNRGSTDQHAYVQQLRDGLDDFFVTFVEVLRSRSRNSKNPELAVAEDYLEGFFLGTREALSAGGRQSLTVTLREISPFSLGMLVALYERAVGIYGYFINVNAYDQPGVEAGKNAATAGLNLKQKMVDFLAKNHLEPRNISAEALAEALQETSRIEWIFKWLEFLRANA